MLSAARNLFFSVIALAGSAPASAQTIGPWTEALVSVTDISAASRLFREVGGWRVTHKGKVARAELDYWNLPDKTTATFLRICAPTASTGCIRFIRFLGAPQRPVRLAARPWDTGGIYSVMVRSDNVAALFDEAIEMGWWAEDLPIGFSFRGSRLKNVVLTGPHGINLAVYERSSPPFTAFPVGRISQAFNAMRFVRHQPVSMKFYRDILGFQVVFDDDATPTEPTPSNFSIPLNYTPKIKRHAAALQPVPGETGRVEVMQLIGFEGDDLAPHASPPNLGILSVRYPVASLSAYREVLIKRGVTIAYEAERVPVAGIGTTNLFAIRDTDGNITEFYEPSARQK